MVDYREHQANGEYWQYFAYSDVTTHSSWTVRRLTPGVEYYFVVGQKNVEGSLEWLPAATFQPALEATACPAYQPSSSVGTAGTQTVDDYVVWKMGEQVRATDAAEIREAVIATHNTFARYGMPRVDETVTIFIYHDPTVWRLRYKRPRAGRLMEAKLPRGIGQAVMGPRSSSTRRRNGSWIGHCNPVGKKSRGPRATFTFC